MISGTVSLQDMIRFAEENDLLPIHRILLGHDGSMTNLLELLTGGGVELRTLRQGVIPCPRQAAGALQVVAGEPVNERDILMVRSSDGGSLLHARSYAPISRLEPAFKSDLMRADIPIGRIIQKHRIEARRELMGVGLLKEDADLQGLLRQRGPYIWRSYRIITRGKPLITIRESFSTSLCMERIPEAVKKSGNQTS